MGAVQDTLAAHLPIVKYDSQEAYFADSAAEWTDNPGNRLVRTDGRVIASAPVNGNGELALGFLGPVAYASGEPAADTDVIGDPKRSYGAQASVMHQNANYANRVYGHSVTDRNGDQWLQYWFFYFYNDYNLIGRLLKGGLHEGDWEMIQIRLRAGTPDHAVYAQHAAAEGRDWRQVDLAPGTQRPIVYVARGSHASYFEPGTHWTGHWFDHADGKRRSPELALEIVDDDCGWVRWPGFWGDTKKDDNPISADSPRGPGTHKQWEDPLALVPRTDAMLIAAPAPRPTLPPAPRVRGSWSGEQIALRYRVLAAAGGRRPTVLVVTINSPDEPAPPATQTFDLHAPRGTLTLPTPVDPSHRYDLYVSAATADGLASESVRLDLAPLR